ncbi:MAG: hypothetical protein H7235_06735, partial [Bdellovibrionaceae bacterium]|nr:hypothetical protein [Pseudobdellovibrionaceae bacterium]
KAKLAIDVRVIDVTTGEVIQTVSTEGLVEDSSFSLDTDLGNYKNQSASPMGKAARMAIEKAAKELVQAIR